MLLIFPQVGENFYNRLAWGHRRHWELLVQLTVWWFWKVRWDLQPVSYLDNWRSQSPRYSVIGETPQSEAVIKTHLNFHFQSSVPLPRFYDIISDIVDLTNSCFFLLCIRGVSQLGFSGSRCWDSIWDTRDFVGLNACENRARSRVGQRKKSNHNTGLKPPLLHRRHLDHAIAIGVVLYSFQMVQTLGPFLWSYWMWATPGGHDLEPGGALQLR